jgi:hypothetical protein
MERTLENWYYGKFIYEQQKKYIRSSTAEEIEQLRTSFGYIEPNLNIKYDSKKRQENFNEMVEDMLADKSWEEHARITMEKYLAGEMATKR